MDLTTSIEPRSDQMRWLPVVGYEGRYEVSDQGHVRSLDRVLRSGKPRRGRVLKQVQHPRGYLLVNLWLDNTSRMWLIHRLVLMAFVGPPPVGTEGLHADGDSGNNALVNLSWGTHSENQYDQVQHGTHVHASKDRCPAGHPYDELNTYVYPGDRPHRACRICRRENLRAWKAANPDRARELQHRAQRRYQERKRAA